MNNTKQVQAMRAAGMNDREISSVINGRAESQYTKATANYGDTQRNLRGNLNSHLMNMLSDASRHYNKDVAAEAQDYLNAINKAGLTVETFTKEHTNTLLAAMDTLNVATNNEFASQSDMAAELARPIQQGMTDEQYQEQLQKEELESHNTRKEDGWELVINPETGAEMERHTGTGEVRVALTNDEMLAEAQAESQANFAQHLTDGYSADSFLDSADSSDGVAMRVV